MEKAWMDYPHGSLEYRVGVLHFLRYAFDDTNDEATKPCPCRNCINSLNHDRQTVHEHLLINGILRDYRIWNFHGEKLIIQSHDSVSNDLSASSKEVSSMANHEPMIQDMLREALGIPEESFMNNENYTGASTSHMGYDSNLEDFYRLVDDAKQPLYAGCTEFSKLTFLVELFKLKVSGKWSDKSFTALLEFLRRALPSEAQVPNSFYEAKKLISKLGLQYEKIHACPNDCMIYFGENNDEQACKVCNLSRWKDLRKQTKKDLRKQTKMEGLARNGNLLPLSFLDWRKMPKNRLDLAWGSVTARFCIPTRHRKIVMQNMGAAWRRWRTEVKATSYDQNIPLEELLQIRPVPHKLTPEVWETLCDYWKKNERTSKINRENAHKKLRIHAQGRINIPTLEDKFFKENGVKPTRVEILELSCCSKKKGGAPIDDEAIRHEALLNEVVKRILQDMPEGTDPRQVHEQAFRKVFGPDRLSILGEFDV